MIILPATEATAIQLSGVMAERSMEKQFSLLELSVQFRLIRLGDRETAESSVGAAGGAWLVGRVAKMKYCPRLA